MTEEMNKAERLALAGYVAPRVRGTSDEAKRRRVARVNAEGDVVGYTTLGEVQKALLRKHAIAIDVPDGVRPDEGFCTNCGRPIKIGKRGAVRTTCPFACGRTCAGFGETACDATPDKTAFTASRIKQRDGEPWRCRACSGLMRRTTVKVAGRAYRSTRARAWERIVEFVATNPDAGLPEIATGLGIKENVVGVHVSRWRRGRLPGVDPAAAPKPGRAGRPSKARRAA